MIKKYFDLRYFNFFLALLFSTSVTAQVQVSGVVKNEKGELLDFTTVFLEQTTYAASSDYKGRYQISDILPGKYSLKATYIGYEPLIFEVNLQKDTIINLTFKGMIFQLNQIEILANRIGEYGPFTRQNLNREALNKENTGQDATFLLQWTPSMVVTSDAGTGIGYSGMRLRGSDQTRINVTLNDVPINDAESQNVFWVNMPDLMSSAHSVQIQRGVGTSTNGAGAFGGTVSINTSDIKVNPFIDIASSYGSFNSRKLSAQLGTGLMENRYSVEGRMSIIKSDGFVDRATADLNSYFLTASRVTSKSSLKFNVIHGQEKTYQAWNGVPQEKVDGNYDDLVRHYLLNKGSLYKTAQDSANLFDSDRSYNYYTYKNQVDNYRQTHLQLIYSWSPFSAWKSKLTLFYTKGKGYFEEFKPDAKWSGYNINPIVGDDGGKINRSDIVRRRWLNNDLLGVLASAVRQFNSSSELQFGISGSQYTGDHYGNVIRSSILIPDLNKEKKYYDNNGHKYEVSSYVRWTQHIKKQWILYGDVQMRFIDYGINGIDKNLRSVEVNSSYTFLNPKIGAQYVINPDHNMYISYAIAQKEPSRGDFIDNVFVTDPKPEYLEDVELGYEWKNENYRLESNLYFMKYKDQLVLTGDLNEVGANLRVNVPESYRFGWETNAIVKLHKVVNLTFNMSLSTNKIKTFTEIIPDYTQDFEKVEIKHKNTDIAFSPSLVGALGLVVKPMKDMEVEWSTKYVGRQFLDNTSSEDRMLKAYHFHNMRISKSFSSLNWKNLEMIFMLQNIFDYKYSSNGYTYSYIAGELHTQNFVYPQAGRNWIIGVQLGF